MRNKAGSTWIAGGILLLVSAAVLYLSIVWDNVRAENAAQEVQAQLVRIQAAETDAVWEEQPSENAGEDAAEAPAQTAEAVIDGVSYLGTLTIPRLELSLPVCAACTDENLKRAACCYAGSTETDDIVICAHNYSGYFGRLFTLEEGDSIVLTAINGELIPYSVCKRERIEAAGVEEMLSGDWDMTLFTCSIDRSVRVTVRCKRADQQP